MGGWTIHLGSLYELNVFRERSQPVLERLVRIDDDFQLAIGQPPDYAWTFWGQRDFDPLAVQTERVGDLKDPADVFERYNF
jgi:hypothetical protein